jgi:hypothetical protein
LDRRCCWGPYRCVPGHPESGSAGALHPLRGRGCGRSDWSVNAHGDPARPARKPAAGWLTLA